MNYRRCMPPAAWLQWLGRGLTVTCEVRFARIATLPLLSLENASVDRMAGHGDEVAHQAIGHLAGHRKLALALELLDCGLGV
jgi:hypothetical protein